MEGHEKSWKVFSYHQILISSEKSYEWYCAVGYVGVGGLQDYIDSPSPILSSGMGLFRL